MEALLSTEKDIHDLVQIWRESFPDEDTVSLYRFFPDFSAHAATYVYKENGKIVSAASYYNIFHNAKKGAYLYGVCTLPSYRRKGLSRRLISDLESLLSRQGYDFIILRPATESLFRFYQDLGYRTELNRMSIIQETPLVTDKNLPVCTPLKADRLDRLRHRYYRKDLIDWSLSDLGFIIDYYSGEYSLALEYSDKNYLIGTVDPEETDRFNLLELGYDSAEEPLGCCIRTAAAIIGKRYPFITHIDVSLPERWPIPSFTAAQKKRFTLCKSLHSSGTDPAGVYFTLVME